MIMTDRREFLKGTAASLVAAGFAGGSRVAAAQTGGAKMKPTAQDVLLVIDVQNCFTPGGSLAVKEGDQIIPLINRLATSFEHVVLTQDWHTPGHVSFASSHAARSRSRRRSCPTARKSSGQITACRARRAPTCTRISASRTPSSSSARVYRKQMDSYSAFYEADGKTPTGLTGYLKDRGLTQVFLVGLATDFCVAWSAMDARKAGFGALVIEDACRGIDADGSLAKAWKDMLGAGVKRIKSSDLAV
jgi:nicotinamidase/pyrazinamidase